MRGTESPKGTAWTRPRLSPLTNFRRDAAKRTWESLAGTCDKWAEKLLDAVDCLPLAISLLCSLAEVSTTEMLWKRWRKENIALLEKGEGDKLESLKFSINLSLESNRMAADGSSKRLLGILSLLPDGMPAFPSPKFRRLFPDIPDISGSLDTLIKCSLAVRTADQRVQLSSLVRLYCKRYDLASPEDAQALRGYYMTSELTPSPPKPYHHSQSLTPKGDSFPTPPLTATREPRRPSGVHEVPGRDAAVNVSQPVNPTTRPAQQSATGARAHLPTVALGDHELNGDSAIAPASTWWNTSKRKRMIPVEQTNEYIHTRSRAIEAISGALGTAARIGHEALFAGVGLLHLLPVPGLEIAGKILLKIWDAVETVETNRVASLRLTERCADILISIRDEIADAGSTVAEELRAPIMKLVEAFGEVHHLLNKLGQRPFLKRYLRCNETLSSISACDTALNDVLGMFGLSVQIRTLKLIQANEQRRQKETHNLFNSLSHVSPQSSTADPENVRKTLHSLRAAQNAQDRAHDAADLHKLMRTALAANDDVAMIDVLQVARSEMPGAIKTLERALEPIIEDRRLDTEESFTALSAPQQEAGKGNGPSVDPGGTDASSADKLDREFIKTGIDVLRRMSKGADLDLPRWTITWYEIDLEAKVGVGFFSDVYRGTWRKHTVAVKVLAETTPRKIFLREVKIWKSLSHPNVLELFGASSASVEPPWFLVSKYYARGSLVKYLKGLSDAGDARVDALKMIHEISEGMAYLHKQDVLHGDLKAANILVDDDTCCVISDFGQSEIKSEVYRITRVSQPRGTLRWQAPEIMQGAQTLTPKMDVYAFAICCTEILTLGALPWPFVDDDTVRHLVLNENKRPSLSLPNLVNGRLTDVIRASWDRVPSKRPSFEKIAREIKKQRAQRSDQSINPQMVSMPEPIPLLADRYPREDQAGFTEYGTSGFEPTVEWGGANAWPSVPRFQPDLDTAEVPANFGCMSDGYHFLRKNPIIPIEIQQSLVDDPYQAGFPEYGYSGNAWPSVPRFHPDMNTAEAPAGFEYVPQNGSTFLSKRPMEMQQPLVADRYRREDQASFAEYDMHTGFEPTVERGGANTRPSLPRFHPDMDTARASAGLRYVSEDGFPIVMQQAFHIIFIIDRSASMSLTNQQPLLNSMGTNRIQRLANDRLGAVFLALYRFWIARQDAVDRVGEPRRDAYSLIFFNDISDSASSIENDFASFPGELVDAALQFVPDSGTDFTSALERAQMVMTTHWSAERAPVVIFLSDGDDSIHDFVSDKSIYTLCRSAARQGMPLSFHAIAFGLSETEYSPSLSSMAQIALEVQDDAAKDPQNSAAAPIPSSYTTAVDTVYLTETLLRISESLG